MRRIRVPQRVNRPRQKNNSIFSEALRAEDLDHLELRLLETLWGLENALQYQLKILQLIDAKIDAKTHGMIGARIDAEISPKSDTTIDAGPLAQNERHKNLSSRENSSTSPNVIPKSLDDN